MQASTVIFTVGVPGAGKSYVRCAKFLVDEFLIHSKGVHFSNFPVNVDAVAEEVYKKQRQRGFFARLFSLRFKKETVEQIKERIHVIPEDVIRQWRNQSSGPWDYFAQFNLSGAHIAIDEIHEVANDSLYPDTIMKWSEWIGTIRHNGCTVEFITQDETQVIDEIRSRAGTRLTLTPSAEERDPFFKILMKDWYELQACFTREYKAGVFEHEYIKKPTKSGRVNWDLSRVRHFRLDSYYFKFYNSFNVSIINREAGKEGEVEFQHEYQKRSKSGLVWWFFARNFYSFLSRFLIAGIIIYICFGGGGAKLLTMLTNTLKASANANRKVSVSAPGTKGKPGANIKANAAVQQVKQATKIYVLESEFTAMKDQLLALKKELDFYKKLDEEGYKLVLMTDTEAVLKNGLVLTQNYVFEEGIFKGEKVVSIIKKTRRVLLSNGKYLAF